jgi:hypothetical protein
MGLLYLYTLAILPGVEEADFEKRMNQEVFPNFDVSRRSIQEMTLEHSLLQLMSGLGQYVWQVRVVSFSMVGDKSAAFPLNDLNEDVRRALDTLAITVSLASLTER